MKETAEEKLKAWCREKSYRGVLPEVVEKVKVELGLTDEDIFGNLDFVEEKEVMADRLLFQKWIELVHETKRLTAMQGFLRNVTN